MKNFCVNHSIIRKILSIAVLLLIVAFTVAFSTSDADAASEYKTYTLTDNKTITSSGYQFGYNDNHIKCSKNGKSIDIPLSLDKYTFNRIIFNGRYLYYSVYDNDNSSVYKYDIKNGEIVYSKDEYGSYCYLIKEKNGRAIFAVISSDNPFVDVTKDPEYNISRMILYKEADGPQIYAYDYVYDEKSNPIDGTYELFDVSKSGKYIYGKNAYINFAGGGYPMYKLTIQNSDTGKIKEIKRAVYYRRSSSGLTYATISKDAKTLNVYTSALSGYKAKKIAAIPLEMTAPPDIFGFVERITSKYVYYNPNTYFSGDGYYSTTGNYAYRYNIETGKKTKYKLESYNPEKNNGLFNGLFGLTY